MNDKSIEFIALAKQCEAALDAYKALKEQLEAKMLELGLDSYHQDPVVKTVYKIIKPTGTFISFRDIDYKRTALEGEKGGTVLSKKEAQEAGFDLGK